MTAEFNALVRTGSFPGPGSQSALSFAHLPEAIEHAAHLLPAQGPIQVFIHHNTLHAFEDLPFTQGVEKAARIFGSQPYLPEARYREELGRGRIWLSDLEKVLHQETPADDLIRPRCSRRQIRMAMLVNPLRFGPSEELHWFVAETDALRRIRPETSAAIRGRLIGETRHWVLRDLRRGNEASGNGCQNGANRLQDSDGLAGLIERFGAERIEKWSEATWEAFTLQALWRVCCDGVAGVAAYPPPQPAPLRHRDLLLLTTKKDTDQLVNEILIPFCGAFLDQGLAHWHLPHRERGFYQAFLELYRLPGGAPEGWRTGLAKELNRLASNQVDPLASIRESLNFLGVSEKELDDFLGATLLALRGWGGIIHFLEERPDRVVHPVPPGSLIELLAIRLLLERLALQHTAREALGFQGSLSELRAELHKRLDLSRLPTIEQRAFLVFQLAQILGWTPEELYRLEKKDWTILVSEIESFPSLERRRLYHLAYERRFYTQVLDALILHNRSLGQVQATICPGPGEEAPALSPRERREGSARFQAMFCIDEREESFRRHVEELAPAAETLGIAGFYFVPMYYRSAADAHFIPLCPAVIQPRHWVGERVVESLEETHQRRAKARRALGISSHQIHIGSRTFVLGALLSATVGVLASLPLVARILFPRLTALVRSMCGRFVRVPRATRLQLERTDAVPGTENGQIGFTLEEMTDIAERVLRDTGLTAGFARLVLAFGHGSTSMNNPHESAHDCGACGGSRGGPNARAIAQMLNDVRVRQKLKQRGLQLPVDTVFVGGLHNTSSEAVTYFDLDRLPESHRQELESVRAIIDQACERNAHERCRRFESAPLNLSLAEGRRHVEGRAEDLAQVRPEWGHATNAICIVGRRQRTRGLFLDRRAFLNSYDPTQDDAEGTILTRILQAAVPVCAGISLEYYFSYVDNPGYGCGTKLPHNITSLLGVMDGAASDLRTGLPWQMVEIHEPVRILFIVETTPETMLGIMDRQPGIGRLVRNEWIMLATLAPDSPTISLYRAGAFHEYPAPSGHMPWAASSVDWYRGWRDHLKFAQIGQPGG